MKDRPMYAAGSCFSSALLVLFFNVCCLPQLWGAEAQDPARSRQLRVINMLKPLPDNADRTIKNPYWAEPAWKLWGEDPAPVAVDKSHFKGTFQPPAASQRKIPVFGKEPGSSLKLIPLQEGADKPAGFWDDCYMSLDNHHTRQRNPRGQFIDGGKMLHEGDAQTRLALGVNFTSQSYADRGRAIVDDVVNNLNTERFFFFANCIRATPSHISFEDKDPEQVKDLYDGIYAHSYHSVGQSGSEMHAVYKMMIAGASLPRSTKNLLKKHGAYAIALLTLFKAALPYADAQGSEVPYEHELRHRPAYSSHGTVQHIHFCPANVHYHGYDDSLHLWRMARMARKMTIAPPVAVLKIADVRIEKDGKPVTGKADIAWHGKSLCLTSFRMWGKKGETLTVTIDLRGSYDLQDQKLRFTCSRLYLNQKNVRIQKAGYGRYTISVSHDPKLPKGRIPVICTARNKGPVPSNPVFVNFYWPGENEVPDYFPQRGLSKEMRDKIRKLGLKRLPVTVNKRPNVTFGIPGDAVVCKAGEKVRVPLQAVDPEGYPVTWYGRSGELGSVEKNTFIAEMPAGARTGTERIHLIASDGTGGCKGVQLKLLVNRPEDSLPEGWDVTALGKLNFPGSVKAQAGSFCFKQQSKEKSAARSRKFEGLFTFRRFSGDVDVTAEIETPHEDAQVGLLLTNTLDDFSRRSAVGFFKNAVNIQMRPGERRWGNREQVVDSGWKQPVKFFRIVSRNGRTALFASPDRTVWTQAATEKITWFDDIYGGFIYGGSQKSVFCRWHTPAGALPFLTTGKAKQNKEGAFPDPLSITVEVPENVRVRYTVNGQVPTKDSPVIEEAIMLTGAGKHTVYMTCFKDGGQAGTVRAVYKIAAPEKEKKKEQKET